MARLLLDSLLVLAFFSLLTSFVEATYIFGLLGTDIPPEIVCVLLLVSPVLLLLVPRLVESRAFSMITGALGLLSWAVSLPLSTRWRMLVSGAGCSLFLLFLAARIRQSPRSPAEVGGSVAIGVLLSVLIRSLRSGNLVLSGGLRLLLGAALAAVALCLLLASPREDPAPAPSGAARAGFWRALGLSLGLFSALALLWFGFTSPAVIARWGETSYPLVTIAVVGAIALFLLLRERLEPRRASWLHLAWNAFFLFALGCALSSRQPVFATGSTYPLYAPAPGLPGSIALWALIVLHPVLYVDIGRFVGALHAERPSPRTMAGAFSVGALWLLLLTFAQIFTTVYDYIPAIGPWFRDRFWLVVSMPALAAALSALLLKRGIAADGGKPAFPRPVLVIALLFAAAAMVIPWITEARPSAARAAGSLRILTWNIQQGIGRTGEKSVELQLDLIRRVQPDIVGLQETDTARIAGGNSDIVRFFADGLDMYSYYGPDPVSGTFGVALLSRYPLQSPRTFFMPSRGEQTAAIEAGIIVGQAKLRVLVTHLDNDGAIAQQRVLLQRAALAMADAEKVVAMGDFNFDPSTEQYRISTAGLEDAWLSAERRVVDPGASDPAGRIDHIFLSPRTRIVRAELLPEGPSDHPALFVEITW